MLKKTAVVLFNVGGPSSEGEIYPFLVSFFSDPAILTLPQPFRGGVAKIIAFIRSRKTKKIYETLGGRSPLLANTRAQAAALQENLGGNFKIFVAMRHAAPLIEAVFKEVLAFSPDEVILLPLVPHYSLTTTGSFFKEWDRVAQNFALVTRKIFSYPTLFGFLEAIHDLILPSYKKAEKFGVPAIILTAHGLPEKIVKQGDPYQEQVEETVAGLKKKLNLPHVYLGYQSRVGVLPWLKPYLKEEIIRLSRKGHPLVIVPLSFVSEHSETLVELDMTLQESALAEGCPAYERVPTVSTHPLFIEGLAALVREQKETL